MSALLTDPTVVALLATADDRVASLRSAILDGTASRVEPHATVESVCDRVAGTHDVGCVVVTDDDPDRDVVAAVARLAEADSHLPVVVQVERGDERLAHEVTRAGASEYVPATVDGDGIRVVVDDAIQRYEERRRHAEESSILSTVLEDLQKALYAKDTEGRHVRAAKVPGGYSPRRLQGNTDVEAYGDEAPEAARAAHEDDMQVIREEEPIHDKLEHHEFETGDHWSETTKVPWYGPDGDLKGLVGISLNATDRMRLERRVEQHEERIDQFASYVSHDLQGPLQVGSGALELAKETGDEAALEKAQDAFERIDEMLDDLSSLAKKEKDTGTFEVEAAREYGVGEPVDLVALVEDVWETVDTKDATLSVAFEEGAIANATETTLRPVFENLFKNAVIHGGADVTVTVGPLDCGGFYVADDGEGIPPEERDKVLEPGYTNSPEGTGTGLSIVAETTESHDWSIAVTESESGGARFEIRNVLAVPRPDQGLELGDALSLTDETDVGNVELEGESAYDDVADQWHVSGAGANIWAQDNDFHYVYAPVEGPVRIQGRIVEIDELSDYTKAGVMVRDDVHEDAPYGYIGVTPHHGTEILWRNKWGEDGISQHLEERSLAYPWYRVDRVGETVTVWLSPDNETWHPVDQRQVSLDDPVYVGLVVCSYTPRRLAEAVFENVTVRRLDVP